MGFLLLFPILAFLAVPALADGDYEVTDQRSAAVNSQMDAVESQVVSNQAAQQVAQASQPQETVNPPSQQASSLYEPIHWLHDAIFSGIKPLDPRHVNTFDMGVAPYYYLYREPDVGVKMSGEMTDYYANYAYRPSDGNIFNNAIVNMYGLQGRYAFGNLDYSGSGTDQEKNYDYEIRALLGRDYLLADHSLVTPYIGFGYRYLFDKGDGVLSSTGAYGYNRHSNYYYLPIGATASIPYKSWTTELNFEYDIFLNGWQVSDLSDGDQFNDDNNPNIHNFQNSGYGIRGSVKLMYNTPRYGYYIEPFFRYWSIEQSHAVFAVVDGSSGYWVEPQNTTLEVGSEFGLQF